MSLVSVITTVYNGQKYIDQAVNSILSQSYADFEYIVVDDGSTDSTGAILDGLQDNRLKVFHKTRLGRARALNFGVENSSGDLVAIMDADDISLPERLQSQIVFLYENREIGLLSSSKRKLIDCEGTITGEDDTKVLDHHAIVKKLMETNPLFHSATMYRREIFDKLGGYDPKLSCFLDYDFYIRSALVTQLANLDKVIVHKRSHQEQYFFGEKGINKHKKLRSAAYINYRKVKYLGAPRRYLLRALKSHIKAVYYKYRKHNGSI